MYEEKEVPYLLECMWRVSSLHTMVLLAYYRRSESAHRAFWEQLPRFFSASKIPEASYGAGPHPAEAGLFRLMHKEAQQACMDKLQAA